jgi:hypothetical protein
MRIMRTRLGNGVYCVFNDNANTDQITLAALKTKEFMNSFMKTGFSFLKSVPK